MLDYDILLSKPTISKDDGEYYKDLLSQTINKEVKRLYNSNLIIVSRDYVCRPDLISLAAYGTDKYADIICKINGISNPFELNEDMILVLPHQNYLDSFVTTAKPSSIVKSEDEILSTPLKTNQKRKNDRRSPAEQVVGENTFYIDKIAKIVYY